jgi:transposase
LSLTPANKSSVGKEKLGRIIKMDDQYLRSLLVVGMRSLVGQTRTLRKRASKWLTFLLEIKAARVATVVMFSKTARIVCVVLTYNEPYSPSAAV